MGVRCVLFVVWRAWCVVSCWLCAVRWWLLVVLIVVCCMAFIGRCVFVYWLFTIAYSYSSMRLLVRLCVVRYWLLCSWCFCVAFCYMRCVMCWCVAGYSLCVVCRGSCVSCRSLIDVRRLLFRDCCMYLPCDVCFLLFAI